MHTAYCSIACIIFSFTSYMSYIEPTMIQYTSGCIHPQISGDIPRNWLHCANLAPIQESASTNYGTHILVLRLLDYGKLVPMTTPVRMTHNQDNSYPRQSVPMAIRTHDSYPKRLVPIISRTQDKTTHTFPVGQIKTRFKSSHMVLTAIL